MSTAALIRSMAAAGAPTEAIALAVEALEAVQSTIAAGRAKEAERTRRYRARGGGAIPEEMRQAVFARDGHACCDCGSADYLQCDHVHPVSKGGATEMGNLQTLCRVCNARKKDRIRKFRGNSTETQGTAADAPPDPPAFPPRPPIPPTLTPVSITTRAKGDFDTFWEAYPRKTDKGNARKAYVKALAKISGPDPPAVLMGALERVKATWTEAQWIPHPSTWLNGERWEDEPETQVIPIRPHNGRSDPLRPDAKRASREANYASSLAGFEIAARGRREF